MRIKTEKDLRNITDKIYLMSRRNKPIYNLIEIMKNKETIITAIHNLESNKGSQTSGIDKKDINNYLNMNEDSLYKTIRNVKIIITLNQ